MIMMGTKGESGMFNEIMIDVAGRLNTPCCLFIIVVDAFTWDKLIWSEVGHLTMLWIGFEIKDGKSMSIVKFDMPDV